MNKRSIQIISFIALLQVACVSTSRDGEALEIRKQHQSQIYGQLTHILSITSRKRLDGDCIYTFSERFEDSSGVTVETEPPEDDEEGDMLLDVGNQGCSHNPITVIRLGNISEERYLAIKQKIQLLLSGDYKSRNSNLVLPKRHPDAIVFEGDIYIFLYSSDNGYSRAEVDLTTDVPLVLSIESWQ